MKKKIIVLTTILIGLLYSLYSYGAPIVVNSTSDLADFGGKQEINDLPGLDEEITLREAIIAANNTTGTDTITFDIKYKYSAIGHKNPLTDNWWVITPATPYNQILDSLTIDGGPIRTINSLGPHIVIDGSKLKNPGCGSSGVLEIRSSGCEIKSLAIGGYAYGSGISVNGININTITIQNNYLGLTRDGQTAAKNINGIEVVGVIKHLDINNNVISGNKFGIIVYKCSDIKILANTIGTNADGTIKISGQEKGIDINKCNTFIIGWDRSKDLGNLISGNNEFGINIQHSLLGVVFGNKIGTKRNGLDAIPNGAGSAAVPRGGIVTSDSGFIKIGNVTKVDKNGTIELGNLGNLISSQYTDISIGKGGPVWVVGNFIGTDITGKNSIGLKKSVLGIAVNKSSGNWIGTYHKNEGNLIAGGELGIKVMNSSNNVFWGNFIGTNNQGLDISNKSDGIFIHKNSKENFIIGNRMAYNNKGIRIINNDSDHNCIAFNNFHNNKNIAIDLGNYGATLNDSLKHTGPNDYLNYPIITSAIKDSAGTTTISGTVDTAGIPGTECIVELYVAEPTTIGRGEHIAYKILPGSGKLNWTIKIKKLNVGDSISALAHRNKTGVFAFHTSEFSPAVKVTAKTP